MLPALAQGHIQAIVIGASSGAVDALSRLLPALPASLRAAVLIVVHLARNRPSLMVEIFKPRCALEVREAEDKEPVAAGKVYFAPPDYHLLLEPGPAPDPGPCIALSSDEPVNFSRPSIDVLFESAVDVYGKHLLGIILTGANEDGAAGLAAVHAAGGTTVVQQPENAQAATMVTAALQRVPADYVLPLDRIAALLSGPVE